jgi:hypothetical protein
MNPDTYFKEKETFTALILSERTKKVLEELRRTTHHLLSIGTNDVETLTNQEYIRHQIKGIMKRHQLDVKTNENLLTKPNIFVSFLILITDITNIYTMADLFELYKEEKRYIQDITIEPLLEESDMIHFISTEQVIHCCCSHGVGKENAFIIKNGATNQQLIVGCDCVLKCLPVSERALLLAKKKNSPKYQKYMEQKEEFAKRRKEKEERDAHIKATYRECEKCGNPNILRTEPNWKINCMGCYVAKQNAELCRGKCLIKIK